MENCPKVDYNTKDEACVLSHVKTMNRRIKDKERTVKERLKGYVNHYLVDGLSGMALGLFSTLIVGLILQQIGELFHLNSFIWMGSMASVLTGVGIGVGVAHKFQSAPLVIYASAVTGFIGGYSKIILSGAAFEQGHVTLIGPGEPLGAFIAVIIGIEAGRRIAGKTRLDIVITPILTIIVGAGAGLLVGPFVSSFMTMLGQIIVIATEQEPFIMGILVSVFMGMILTLPISSAALSIILGLNGLAAGAATVGCATQMIGFAVASYRENKVSGLLAQGLGTSMLQVPNIVRNPRIWMPPILASAILGPISTMVFKMTNNASGAGMGTSGLVGQMMTWKDMSPNEPAGILVVKIIVLHVIMPAVLTLIISEYMRKKQWIRFGDMVLDQS